MGRFSRVLSGKEAAAAAAPPPEAVAMDSDFVVILAVLLCALICVVGLIAATRCVFRRRRNNSTAAATGVGSLPSANKGLKKKVLQSLPKFTYSSTTTTTETIAAAYGGCLELKLPPLWTDCPICLGEFMEGDEVRILPSCGHGFHVACIDKWLGSHSSCPSCRQVLVVGRCGKCGQSLSAASGRGGGVAEAAVNGGPDANAVNNTFLA